MTTNLHEPEDYRAASEVIAHVDVRYGSKVDVLVVRRYVRFTLKSGHC
jgi:hypothetical protein